MTSVAIVDDSALLREGIARLLVEAGYEVAGSYGDADALLGALQAGSVAADVVIMDVRMPPTYTNEGLTAAATVREKYPDTAVLLLSQYVEAAYAAELFAGDCGALGYLLKDRVVSIDALTDALERVRAGGVVLDPEVVGPLMRARRDPLDTLTAREREVLELMAQGRTNAEIAELGVVNLGTVEKQVGSIFTKLGLGSQASGHRRVLAVLAWLQRAG